MSKTLFFLIGMGVCYLKKKNILHIRTKCCYFGLSCYIILSSTAWIVNLIQFLQEGLEIVLFSWRTFPLTDLHSAEHLWGVGDLEVTVNIIYTVRYTLQSKLCTATNLQMITVVESCPPPLLGAGDWHKYCHPFTWERGHLMTPNIKTYEPEI